MIIAGLWTVIRFVVDGLLNMFPRMSSAAWTGYGATAAGAWGWLMALNASLPVVELLGALGVLLGVVVVLYGVMLVRRVFSLFWPGAGS